MTAIISKYIFLLLSGIFHFKAMRFSEKLAAVECQVPVSKYIMIKKLVIAVCISVQGSKLVYNE